jgi:hypothetical protein
LIPYFTGTPEVSEGQVWVLIAPKIFDELPQAQLKFIERVGQAKLDHLRIVGGLFLNLLKK